MITVQLIISIFSSSQMIKEDNLCIFITFYLNSFGSVTWWVNAWVDINDLSISFISEKKALIVMSIHSEIWRLVNSGLLSIPVEETQIGMFR